jgi:ferric-dicitrate binding protein FerR (iron transport regulator)
MKNEDIQEFVIDCLADSGNRDKQAALAQWLQESEENRILYEETKRIWDMAEAIPATPFSTAEGWEALSQHIKVKKMFPWKRVAAVLLPVCIAAGIWYYNTRPAWTNFIAQSIAKDSILLSDGSVIYAKKGTVLSYKDRVVKLESGEAFFEIAKDEQTKFVVRMRNATITVLGTSFNIKMDTNTEVAVLDGKISMTTEDNIPVILTKGEMARLDKGSVNKIPGNNHSYQAGWVSGDFVFKNEEAGTVVDVLSAYYHIQIPVNDSLRKRRITVKFSNASIEEVKMIMAEVLDK